MSNLFISYKGEDEEVARLLEKRLIEKGHRVAIPVGAAVSGLWRTKFIKGLVGSDVFLMVLSTNALESKNVLGEIGAARALDVMRGMVLLPVLVGDLAIPPVVSDLYCFRLQTTGDADLTGLVERLDKAIADDLKLAPRIFISHRHIDEPIAGALVALLEQAFELTKNDIRCTSVKPYVLSPGARTSEQLRADLARAELVIGILSPDTLASNYVLCELGASWGRNVPTFPVLARGATISDVPPPLNELHSMSLESRDNCVDLVEYVRSKTTLKLKDAAEWKLADCASALSEAAKTARAVRPTGPTLQAGFMDRAMRKNGRYAIRLGIRGCPSDTIQVVFCANDEGLLTGRQLENDLCQVVRTNPVGGEIWAPENESWSVSGNCRFFAIGIRGDTYFAASSGLCEAIESRYRFTGKRAPGEVMEAIRYLDEHKIGEAPPKM